VRQGSAGMLPYHGCTRMAAAATSPAVTARPGREYGLDWLRVFAFAILIFYHSGMPFVRWDFHIKNAETSTALEYVMLFFNRWRLPLLFFISGAGVSFSLRRRGWGQFAGDRLLRLLLPLAFGMFVIVPPQIWYERLHHGATFSYAEFYPTVFEFVSYPKGNTSWHHLWFVVYILVFSLACIPLFALLRSSSGRRGIDAFADALERWPAVLYAITWPSIAVSVTLGPRWPATHNLIADWANLIGCLVTFLWGFVFASNQRLLDVLTRRRRELLGGAVAIAALFFTVYASGVTRSLPAAGRLLVNATISSYFGALWIFALVGYARAKLHRDSPRLRYATEAVYPFYIVHQTVTIAAAYYIIQWSVGVWPKLIAVGAATFIGSWAIVELVRRVTPLRPLFGLKLRT
jgi:glucans biosynthesis protein C